MGSPPRKKRTARAKPPAAKKKKVARKKPPKKKPAGKKPAKSKPAAKPTKKVAAKTGRKGGAKAKPATSKKKTTAGKKKAAPAPAAAKIKQKKEAPAEVPEFLVDGPANAARTLILAHGAGAPMDSPFLETLAKGVAAYGFKVVRFEFPYMRRRRETKRKSAPDREAALIQRFKEVVKAHGGPKDTIIGGKSLGGRIASLIADDLGVDGLVCLGYPFHPTGKPQETRTAHLADLRTPTLIIQGERDPFGSKEEIRGYPLSWHIQVAYLPDGDHSFKPRKDAPVTEQDNLDEACRLVATFCRRPNLPPAPVFVD